jgi:hypothetical protein
MFWCCQVTYESQSHSQKLLNPLRAGGHFSAHGFDDQLPLAYLVYRQAEHGF